MFLHIFSFQNISSIFNFLPTKLTFFGGQASLVKKLGKGNFIKLINSLLYRCIRSMLYRKFGTFCRIGNPGGEGMSSTPFTRVEGMSSIPFTRVEGMSSNPFWTLEDGETNFDGGMTGETRGLVMDSNGLAVDPRGEGELVKNLRVPLKIYIDRIDQKK